MAAAAPGTDEQERQGVLTDMAWDEIGLSRQWVEALKTLHTENDGFLVLDDTSFVKPGEASVGVGQQYPGTVGQVGNDQPEVALDLLHQACSRKSKHARVVAETSWAWPYDEPPGG